MTRQDSDREVGTYYDGVGDEMTDEEVREMLRIHILDGWYAEYKNIGVTLHRDGGATIKLEMRDRHVKGIAEGW